jgi:AAA domain-containing protein/DnaB helicase-like protein
MSLNPNSRLPRAEESEKAAIGAILMDQKYLGIVLAHLHIEDFNNSWNREILRAIGNVKRRQRTPDLVTVVEELGQAGKLESAGGAAYVASLLDSLPDRPNLEAYIANVHDAARARSLHAAALLACTSIEQGESVDRVLGSLQQKELELSPVNTRGQQKLFVEAPKFIAHAPEEIDWLVEGLIEKGANGFVVAVPKGGKSWAAVDLALSLALGCDWLGFRIPDAARVALISREDNPSLTAWRIRHLFAGKVSAAPGLIETNLYVNSRAQSPELMLDNVEQMAEILAALKQVRPRFAIFDVFNVLHCADENDAQEMRRVLRQLSIIQAEVGCGIGVVHHYNKTDQGSMTQRLRGSSAIAGWAEWLVGISMADEESKTRRMEFELKAAQPPDPIYYRIESSEGASKLSLSEPPSAGTHRREGGAAERYM